MSKLRHRVKFQRVTAPKRLQALGLTVVVLLGGLTAYFTTYISNQRDYYTHRNFRELKSLSEQIRSRIQILGKAFHNAASKTANDPAGATTDKLANALSTLAPLRLEGISVGGSAAGSHPAGFKPEVKAENIRVTIDVTQADGESWLQFLGQHSNPDLTFAAKANFNDIIDTLIGVTPGTSTSAEEQNLFDEILIARAGDSGEVIYSGDTSNDNLNLNIVTLKDIAFLDSSDNKLDYKLLTNTTSQADVAVGGVDYKFYLQPLANPLPPLALDNKSSPTPHWVVCGMVQGNHFRHETWAISYTILISLAFLCAMVALSWPILRLFFLGPKDRLRLADIYLLGLSLLLGSAVLTLFLLWGYTYASHQDNLDRNLEALAQSVSARLKDEVESVVDQLTLADNELIVEMDKSSQPEGSQSPALVRAGILDPRGENHWRTIPDATYPYFNTLFWMDSAGNQRALWTINPTAANLHPVKDRPYFTRISDGKYLMVNNKPFWLEPIKSRATGAKTAIISTKSKFDHGQGVAAVDTNLLSAMNALLPDGFGYRVIDDQGEVLFHSAECEHWMENFFDETDKNPILQSWVQQRLGGNLDINYSGQEHHLYVKPLDIFPNWTLIAIRRKQPLRALYLETVTLTGFMFFCYALVLLVIFSAVYIVRVNARSRTEWLWPAAEFSPLYAEFLFINLALVLLLTIEVLFVDGAWLVVSVFLTAIAGVANLVFRRRLSIARHMAERFQVVQHIDFTQVYVVNIVMVLAITGILPAVAFFKVTYNKGMKLFNLQEQMSIAANIVRRDERIKAVYSTDKGDNDPGPFQKGHEADAAIFSEKRRKDTRDIYLPGDQTIIFRAIKNNEKHAELVDDREAKNSGTFALSNKLMIGDEVPNEWISAASALAGRRAPSQLGEFKGALSERLADLMRRVPFFREFVQSKMFNHPRAQDGSWAATNDSPGYLLRFGKDGDPNTIFVGTSPLRTFQSPPQSLSIDFLIAVLAFLSIPLLLYFLVRFAANRIFLTDLAKRFLRPIPQNEFLRTNQNLFVILSSPLVERDLPPYNGDVLRIDLRKDLNGDGSLDAIRAKLKSEKRPRKVLVDHFEARITDLEAALLKLELLDELLLAKRTTVIMSTADPSAFSAFRPAKADEPIDDSTAQEFADRWANLSARFLQVYLVESGNSKAFDAVLDKRNNAEELPRKAKKHLSDLLDLVREECEPRGALQRIGREIIRQSSFAQMDPAEVFRQISSQARLYYQRVWKTCSEGEKLTLMHLAEDRYLSRKDPDLRVLLRKGLIVRAPDLRLMNLTFKHFLLTQCSQSGLVTLEDQAKKVSTWETLKAPLLIGFVGMILFLVLTQKQFYSNSLTIITAMTTGIPALFKLLSLFQLDGPQKVLTTAATQLTK